MKHDNEYLYGSDVEVPEIPGDIIVRRLELLQDNLRELLDHSYHTRDGERVNAVLKAIDFWEKINER
jgi:hypothetical protein